MDDIDPVWAAMTAAELRHEMTRRVEDLVRIEDGVVSRVARTLQLHTSDITRLRTGAIAISAHRAQQLDEKYPNRLGPRRSFAALVELYTEAKRRERAGVGPSVSGPLDADATYELATALLRAFRPRRDDEIVRHAAMHGHSGFRTEESETIDAGPPPTPAMLAFDAAFNDLINGRTGVVARVRLLVTIPNQPRLHRVVSRLRCYDAAPAFEARALIAEDSVPVLVPLIVGDDVMVAVDDERTYRVSSSIRISGPEVARWAARYFDALWDDARCFRVRPPSGIDERAVSLVRAKLAERE